MELVRKSEGRSIGVAWGVPGAPLLPASLREIWKEEALPPWVCTELDLPPGSTMERLDAGVLGLTGRLPERVANLLIFLVHSRRNGISHLVAVKRVWPAGLSFGAVPWKTRTRNCLLQLGLHDRLIDLSQVTLGELFAVPGMGAVSILDFACTLEATLDEY